MRAQKRAARSGGTRYRGRWYNAAELGVQHDPPPPRTRQPQCSASGKRLAFLSWNASGLTIDRHKELQTWLLTPEGSRVDLVAIQETHWKGQLEYNWDRFSAIHSGGNKSEAGLLLLVSRQRFPEHSVHYQEVIPGRLLHVRLLAEPCTDVILLYQYAWSITKSKEGKEASKDLVLAKRAEVWAQLATLLNSLPKRNQVVLMGDFNCSLEPQDSLIGCGVQRHLAAHASDVHMLKTLVEQHRLVVLNTWSRRGKAASTDIPATSTGHSQIDFVMLNQEQCDQSARQTRTAQLPFVPITGMRHLPLLGSFRLPRVPTLPKPFKSMSRQAVNQAQSQSPDILAEYQARISDLSNRDSTASAEQLIEQAWTECRMLHQMLPARGNAAGTRSTGQAVNVLHPTITTLWQLRAHILKMQKRGGLRCYIRLWQAYARLQKIQMQLRRRCRDAKKVKIQNLLQDAASQPQSLPSVFRLLRWIAPPVPKRRLQLRTDKGMPCSTQEALQEIRTYFHDLYHTSPDTCIGRMQPPEQPIRFSVAEFEAALAELPSNKAVPATLPPALLWKTAASCLAQKLTPQLNEWLADMTRPPPSEWHVADIFLLLKPGKKPSAAALRPISLLHPVAKALATMLKHRVQPAVNTFLEQLPQYAYTQQRSAQDALDRAFTHCTLVQAILRAQTLTPQARKQGHQVLPCRGGITLSVDLRKAFDLMPREHLLSALSQAKIDDAHCWTIMQLHAHAQMQFSYAQNSTRIDTSNGIRQGCGLAPTLWSLFTAVIMHKLLEKLTVEEIIAFADDWLFQWVINKAEDLQRAVDLIGFILEVLQSFGMQPSLDKTVVLMQLKGSSAARIRRRYVSKHPKLGVRLRVCTAQGRIELPLVDQHTYLGVKISYGQSEAATVRYRVQQSWKVFNRLMPSLRSASLPRDLKLAVWRACAFACLMYGLDCIILPPQSAQKLQQVVVRQLRIMLKSPVFITREPAELFLRRIGIQSPAVEVANRIRARVSKCRQGPMAALQPLRTQQRWRYLDEAAALSQEYAAIPVWHDGSTNADTQIRLQEVQAQLPRQICQHCGLSFRTLKALRSHVAQKHSKDTTEPPKVDMVRRTQQQMRKDYMCHASGGLPTCVHCHWNFSSWPAFCEHFEHKRCVALHLQTQVGPITTPEPSDPAASPGTYTEPPPSPNPSSSIRPEGVQCDVSTPEHAEDTMCGLYASLPEVVLGLCSAEWNALADHVRQEDQHTCMFCKQWLAKPNYLTRHITAQHGVLREVLNALPSWLQARRPTVFSPCRWCYQDFKAQHSSRSRHVQSCTTLIRTGIYHLLHCACQELPPFSSNGALGGGSPTWCSSRSGQSLGADNSSPLRRSSTLSAVDGRHSHSYGHASQGGQARQRLGHGQRCGQVSPVVSGERRGIWFWLGKQKAERMVEESQERLRRGEQKGEGGGGDPEPLREPLPFGSEARRPAGHRSYGERLHHVLPDDGDVVGATGYASVHRSVDQDEGGQPRGHHLTTTSCHAEAAAGPVAHQESLNQAKKMLILNPEGQIPYLQYNRQTEQLEIKPDREPMELKTVLEILKELKDLVLLPNTTLRFHAARKLTSQPKGEIVPMMLEIGVRTREADRAWELLARLCHSGACRAVAMSLRQERMGRSALAKQVQQMVEGLSEPYS